MSRPDGLPTGPDLTAAYLQSVSRRMDGPGLTPAVLAHAAADVLPVDAAGISTLLAILRLPLGSSNDSARTAEELQTSLGEGPCLAAAVAKATCAADEAEMMTRWPVYSSELVRKTSFRSVASVPLSSPDREVFAALDLYAEDPQIAQRLDLHALDAAIARPASALLSICLASIGDEDLDDELPDWYREATARRHHVWVASGMIIGGRAQPTRDAISVLRGYAYANDLTLDGLADDLVSRRLTLDDLDH